MVLFETILRVLLALGQVILLQKIAHKDEHLVFFIEFMAVLPVTCVRATGSGV